MLSFLASVLLLAGGSTASADSSAIYAGLERGPHTVGYRLLLERDPSRHALRAEGPTGSAPRPIVLSVWYPAQGAGRTLRFGEYFDAPLPSELGVAALTRHAVELGGADAVARPGLQRLGAVPTWARRDATPAPGRHPLVLLPAWLLPGTVSIMAEYLASHGFVVAGVLMRGTDQAQPDISMRGLSTQASDLQFAAQRLTQLPMVDDGGVAVMGTGINASAGLELALRSDRVRALVSLEGGITTPFELRMIRQSPFFDARRLTAPILAITAPHPSVDAARLDIYRHAPQHRVHFPRSGEFWMLNFGAMESVVPGLIGRAPGDVGTSYATAARYVERFLSAYLRADTAARRFLSAPPAELGVPSGTVTVETRPARPVEMSRGDLLALLETSGVDGVRRRLREIRERDPQPVSAGDFVAADRWLAQHGDSAVARRVDLAMLRAAEYPASANAQYRLALLMLAGRDSTAAARPAARAAELLANDADPALDEEVRAQVLALAARLRVRAGR